jgi:hypothetical protein
MTLELTETQRKALKENGGSPRLRDPDTDTTYVLVREDIYDRIKGLLDDDWPADERLRLLAESGKRAGWADPPMDDYDNYEENRNKLCP